MRRRNDKTLQVLMEAPHVGGSRVDRQGGAGNRGSEGLGQTRTMSAAEIRRRGR